MPSYYYYYYYYYYYLDKSMPLLFYAIYSQDAPCYINPNGLSLVGMNFYFENSGYELNCVILTT